MTSRCDPTDHDEDKHSERSHPHSQINRPHSSCCNRLQPPNFKIQPFDGNPKNYARFKAKFQALYEEYEDSPVLLFMLEELLAEEVRNEVGECLTDGTMYSVVWERLDAVFGRTEIMDQTYLDDLLQVPPLKSMDAASLKTFANRLHGAVATLSKSKYTHELYSRPPQDGRPFIAHLAIEERSEDLNELVKKFWQLEANEVEIEPPVLSEEDLRGKRILESSVKRIGNQYQVGLMWKADEVDLPNNRAAALKRLYALERRFHRDEEFAHKYDAVVKEYIGLKHARLLTTQEAQTESTKTCLLGVLIRFRRNLVPVGADIEKMFHQVKVPEADQAAFRFLYRTPGSNSAPLTYQMTVHVFGAISSPTSCIFALNRTADDYRSQFPDVADSVRRNFYVDNYLDSFESEDEVIKRSREMKSLLQLGGFNLTKWTSSSRTVIAALREFGLASPTLNLDLEKLPVERTLGVMWDSERDMLSFKIRKPPNNVTLTKRAFLSIISSVYDPLGLVAPVIFVMKSLLQDIWTNEERIGWDDVVPETLSQRFYGWYDHLENLESLSVPRCFRFIRGRWTQQHLYVFTDASSKGFGAVAYFRTVFEDHSVNVSFVMSKTHVTPVKGLTIPRLELQAAVEGLNLALTICRELEIDLRGIDPKDVDELVYFHRGPAFLNLDPSEWYIWEEITEPEERDVNVIRVLAVKTEDENHVIDRCVARFSSLVKIQRVLAWSRRFTKNARAKLRDEKPMVGELTVEEMVTSLTKCIVRAQELAFAEEVYALRKNLELPLRSKLRNFKPFLDEDGQMRIGGRILLAPIDYAAKHPILLPASQLLTKRIIWDYHVRNIHVKTERLLTDLRSHYWILSGRKVVKSVLNNCWPCKRTSAKPSPPLMASLPVHRLTPHLAAFTYTGIDYFGPLTVRVGGRGRRHEKRWISLFTCFTTRAVHLEVANGLSMEEFLLCFSRFVSLRGKPKVVYSDNGTNFVAAEQELRQALEELISKHEELQTLMPCQQIEWHFSPPHGPHFGGVWERIVQSCKRAMKSSKGNCLVTDQVLRTVIAEVAALLNARPLTHLSVDPEDPDPLTPNHFLYGGARPYFPLQLADVEDLNVTNKQFQQSQAILQHFWNRWLREYVPHLTERRKWQENRPNVTVGYLVLAVEPSTLRGQWPMGQVLEVIPSATDNVVRVVKVKLSNHPKPCIRPVAKLCIMVPAKEQQIYAKDEKMEPSTA
ncbi:uncharacterized protein LOC130697337 [Daphnia carinata]|uniref:uncharacterized protein LOC130697337 n=1 Tax=Daphnia carinata TaxID=120202 RepID=UPI00258098D3|nr:uncharacterized protein LOC130697337 [Daphnia carinata]